MVLLGTRMDWLRSFINSYWTDFLSRYAEGVAVSAVTATVDGDASRLHWLPWRTGGDAPPLRGFFLCDG